MAGVVDIEIPKMQEVFVGEIVQNGNWIVANLKSRTPWPIKVTKVEYMGRTLFLIPPTVNDAITPVIRTFPAVALLLLQGEQMPAGQVIVSKFLSALAWVTTNAILVDGWSGGNLPRPMGGLNQMPSVTRDFYQPYLPVAPNDDARLALAFFREAMGLNHVAYECLSFFKVLNIFLRTGAAQENWINANIGNITEHRAKQRISLLSTTQGNVGQYLYGSNRCAVAHAGGNPTADPEDPEDLRRLHDDLPLVHALAEYAIEHQFGIKSRMTVYREHLYELEGFRSLFGDNNVQAIKDNGTIPKPDWARLPNLSVRLALMPPYAPLENLAAQVQDVRDGRAVIHGRSADGLTEVVLGLDFRAERLEFDFDNSVVAKDDGSERAARQAAIIMQFLRDYFANGILEIWDAGNNVLLGRRDAFLPMNVDMQGTMRNLDSNIRDIEAEADRRAVAAATTP